MSILYSNSTNQSLNSLRHKRLIEKTCVAKSFVKPESLPPTESATKYQSYRTYYQIMQWKHGICSLFPTSWCWIEASGEFAPVLTDFAAAPLSLLNIIRCQCNTDCSTRRCGCLKNNIPCSVACSVKKIIVQMLKKQDSLRKWKLRTTNYRHRLSKFSLLSCYLRCLCFCYLYAW